MKLKGDNCMLNDLAIILDVVFVIGFVLWKLMSKGPNAPYICLHCNEAHPGYGELSPRKNV